MYPFGYIQLVTIKEDKDEEKVFSSFRYYRSRYALFL
jgi:hypothetical protein